MAGGIAVYLLRGWSRITDSRFYAEDGSVFFSGAWNEGASVIVESYAGYIVLVPRLVAEVAVALPLWASTTVLTVAAVIAFLFCAATVLSARFSTALPSQAVRAMFFFVLCVIPPMGEVYGNVSNLVAVAGLFLLLSAVSTDPTSRWCRSCEILAVALAALTGPYCLLLFPLYWRRWQLSHRSRHARRLATVVTACATVQAATLLLNGRDVQRGGLGLLAEVLADRLAGAWLVGVDPAFWGPHAVMWRVVALVWLVAVGWSMWHAQGPGRTLLATALFLVSISVFTYGQPLLSSATAAERQFLVPLAALLLGVFMALQDRGQRRRVAVMCLLAGVAAVVISLPLAPHLIDTDVTSLSACLDLRAGPCTMMINPAGWSMTLR